MTRDLDLAKATMRKEVAALEAAAARLGSTFVTAVDRICSCTGKVIVSGLGKSGIVGNKIAATLASTGTPSVYLHPVEALHGDLGILQSGDVGLLLSNSGETKEMIDLLQHFKRIGMGTIALTGESGSTLALHSDIFVDAHVDTEACPLNLAPTSSAIVEIALGDALAACLMNRRGFTEEDFARLHPSGALGHRLWLRVRDVMHSGEELPLVAMGTRMADVLLVLTSKALGAVLVVLRTGQLAGIYTDGDLKRTIQQHEDFLSMRVEQLMTENPVCIQEDRMAVEALAVMENRPSQIAVLPVLSADKLPVGIVRIHDLVKAGI